MENKTLHSSFVRAILPGNCPAFSCARNTIKERIGSIRHTSYSISYYGGIGSVHQVIVRISWNVAEILFKFGIS